MSMEEVAKYMCINVYTCIYGYRILDDVGDHTVTFTVTDEGTPRSDSEQMTITVDASFPTTTVEL